MFLVLSLVLCVNTVSAPENANASKTMHVVADVNHDPRNAIATTATTPPPSETAITPTSRELPSTASEVSYQSGPLTEMDWLMDQVILLEDEVAHLRAQLAKAQLEAATAIRELSDLQQYIADHQQYGTDFSQYQAVRKAAETEARRKQVEESKAKREAAKAEKAARMEEARARKQVENGERDRLAQYEQAGFGALGLEVWLGKSAYSYNTDDSNVRVKYDPDDGSFFKPDYRQRIDYSHMTISGSVLNSSQEVRNIGVAIVFFDDYGSQVGGTTVQINNARPDVPYPFTSQLDMVLNRAFTSTTSYVLYADPIEPK